MLSRMNQRRFAASAWRVRRCSSSTKRGTTTSASSTAAVRAGWSWIRRSRRNQTMATRGMPLLRTARVRGRHHRRAMRLAADIQLPNPCLVALVGAAGSGKSTFAARHFAPDEVLSSDAYRGYVAGDPANQRATHVAFAALHRTLASRLRRGRLTVVDATSVRPAARSALLRLAASENVP